MEFDLRGELHRLGHDPVARATRLPVDTLTVRLRRRRAARRTAVATVGTLTAGGLVVAGLVVTGATGVERLQQAPPPVAATSDPAPTASTAPSPTSTPSPTSGATPTATPSAAPTPSPAPTPEPTPVAPEAAPPVVEPTPGPTSPERPVQLTEFVHGGEAWAVYVVADLESMDSPERAEAHARIEAAGYQGFEGSLGCDRGAEVIGADPSLRAVSVYFSSQADAELFVGLYGHEVAGVALVTMFCLD